MLLTNNRVFTKFRFIIFISLFWFVVGVAFNYINYKVGIVSTFISIILFLFLDTDKMFLFIISALPFAAIFKISPNLPSSIILFYILFIFKYISKDGKIEMRSMIYLMLFAIFQITTIIIYGSSIVNIISFIINIIFAKILMLDFQNKKNKEEFQNNCILMFSLALGISIILADLFPNILYLILYEKQVLLESVGRFSGLNGDPNYYSQLILVGISLLVTLAYKCWGLYKKNIQAISLIILANYLFINGIRSGSKSFVITFVVMIILFGYYMMKDSVNKKALPLKVILIMLLFPIIILLFTDNVMMPIFAERSSKGVSVLTNRDIIWDIYLEGLKNNPLIILIGAGISNERFVIGRGLSAHNVYLELISGLGIIGIFCLFNFWQELQVCFKYLFKKPEYLFVWSFLITSFSLSLSSNDAIFIFLPLMILSNEGRRRYND